jgi:hypothetical protein
LRADSGKTNDNSLFKIGRSKDANEIYYEVKTTPGGLLDIKEPIKIYWIKYTDNNAIEPLTLVQQKFAYGLKFLKVNSESAEFQFVSYSKRTLSLRKTAMEIMAFLLKLMERKWNWSGFLFKLTVALSGSQKSPALKFMQRRQKLGNWLVEVIEP